MDTIQTQQIFFNQIRSQLPGYISFVEEIATQLDISTDSAYRRIRGEKPLSLDEVQILCSAFNISVDQIFQVRSNNFIFSGNMVDNMAFGLEKYLEDITHTLEMFKTIPDVHLYYYNKDIPIFHHMQFAELSAFKFFFWKRTVMGYPELARIQFSADLVNRDAFRKAAHIMELYNQLPSTEIWNEENVHSTIRQIEFYRQSNVFANPDILQTLYSQLEELLNHLQLQAEAGRKFGLNRMVLPTSQPYSIYVNECLIGDNTIFVNGNGRQIAYLNHNGLNFLGTHDKAFCDYTYKNMQNIIRKSTQISVAGEKERSMFFNTLRDKIYERRKSI